MESRAQLGIAGSALYPQLQQVNAEALRVGNRGSDGRGTSFWSGGVGFRPGLGAGLLGQVQAWHRVGRCRLLRQHRAVRRRAGAGRGAGGEPVRVDPHAPSCGCASPTRTPRSSSAAWRSPKGCSAAATMPSSTCSRRVRSTSARWRRSPRSRAACARRATRCACCSRRPPDALPELQGGRAKIPEARLEAIVDMPAELLRRRPDVRAAEMQLAAQSAQIGVSEAALYPSIALAGSVGLSATSIGSPSTTLSWALGPALVWNVFDHGRLTNQVLVQDARFQQLYEQYQDVVLRAARELDDAASSFAYTPRAGRHPARCGAGRAALARHRDGPVPRGPGRLPARARFAAGAVQCAGTPGRQPGRRRPVPDRGLQGDGRRLAGRPLAAGARRRHASHDGRAQRLEIAAAGPLAAAFGRVPASLPGATRHEPGPCRPARRSRTEPRRPAACGTACRPHPRAAAPASAPWSSRC